MNPTIRRIRSRGKTDRARHAGKACGRGLFINNARSYAPVLCRQHPAICDRGALMATLAQFIKELQESARRIEKALQNDPLLNSPATREAARMAAQVEQHTRLLDAARAAQPTADMIAAAQATVRQFPAIEGVGGSVLSAIMRESLGSIAQAALQHTAQVTQSSLSQLIGPMYGLLPALESIKRYEDWSGERASVLAMGGREYLGDWILTAEWIDDNTVKHEATNGDEKRWAIYSFEERAVTRVGIEFDPRKPKAEVVAGLNAITRNLEQSRGPRSTDAPNATAAAALQEGQNTTAVFWAWVQSEYTIEGELKHTAMRTALRDRLQYDELWGKYRRTMGRLKADPGNKKTTKSAIELILLDFPPPSAA
jgi:hypothetical protein